MRQIGSTPNRSRYSSTKATTTAGGGSSFRAKKPEAANKISLARFSSLTSRSRSLIRRASPVVVPGRCPPSTRCCLTQPRNVSGTTPTRSAILITGWFIDNDGSSAIASDTRGTERSRSSAGTSLVLAQPHLVVRSDHARNPGRLTVR